jgi:tetratricopeptide (TPR) repeat protein
MRPLVRVKRARRRQAMPGALKSIGITSAAMLVTLLAGPSSSLPKASAPQASAPQASAQDELGAAAAAERSGNYDDAARHYQNFLSTAASVSTVGRSALSPAIIEARTRLGTALFMLHRYRESLSALRPLPFPAGSGGPHRVGAPAIPAQAWLVEGLDYLDLNQLSDATRFLRQAIALNPNSGTARLALGDALARSDHPEDAEAQYREQLRRTPDVLEAWYKLGLVYTNLAQRATAGFSEQQGGSVLARQLAAEQLSDRGDYWGAAQALFPVVDSSGPGSNQQIAKMAADQGTRGSAGSAFQPGLHASFGTALLYLSYPRAAEKEFEAELSGDPESLPAQLGKAEVAALHSDWDGALAIFGHLMDVYPAALARRLEMPPPARLVEAWPREESKLQPPLAEAPAAKLWAAWLGGGGLKLPPAASGQDRCSSPSQSRQHEPGYWMVEACAAELRTDLGSRKILTENERAKLVETDYRLGDYEKARDGARALLRLSAHDPWGGYWLAKSYSALIGECFARLSDLNPDSARVHEILANYDADRQQWAPARNEYEAALRLAPELPDLHLGLGTVYWRSGDWSRALDELKKTLDLAPGSTVAAYELGDSYIQEHQWRDALDYLPRALKDPAVERKARLDLAKAEGELGDSAAAIKDLSLLAADDHDGEVHYRLAMAYRGIGDSAKAQAALGVSEALRKTSDQLTRQRLETLEGGQKDLQHLDGGQN